MSSSNERKLHVKLYRLLSYYYQLKDSIKDIYQEMGEIEQGINTLAKQSSNDNYIYIINDGMLYIIDKSGNFSRHCIDVVHDWNNVTIIADKPSKPVQNLDDVIINHDPHGLDSLG